MYTVASVSLGPWSLAQVRTVFQMSDCYSCKFATFITNALRPAMMQLSRAGDWVLLVGSVAFVLLILERPKLPDEAPTPVSTTPLWLNVRRGVFDFWSAYLGCFRFWWMAYAAAGMYVCMVTLRSQLHLPLRSLRATAVTWNSSLAIFSMWGTAVTVPPTLAHAVYGKGLDWLLCEDPLDSMSTAFHHGVFLFVLSKFPELLDTALLIAKGREVSFLHWYHHTTVLLYTWYAFLCRHPSGLMFVAMNYLVHSVMYTYYARSAYVQKRLWWAPAVTVMQTAQMVAGLLITFRHARLSMLRPDCFVHTRCLLAAGVLYATYFGLFASFFVSRHLHPHRSGKPKAG
jgi:hypothetical protein